MLSWLGKLWSKLSRPATTTPASNMDTEVRMGDVDSPSAVWIPSHHLERHRSFRRQLSRKLSSRAKQLGVCNSTACAIAVCFILAFFALIVSCFTFYLYVKSHGLGHEMEVAREAFNPHSASHYRDSPPPQVFDGLTTEMPQRAGNGDEESAKSAYAHIVGISDGPRQNDEDFGCLNIWKVNTTHNVKFLSSYGIEILEPGFYYVYTQIYFSDPETDATYDSRTGANLPMRSTTNRNHVPLMQSVAPFNEYSTKYHGGVFHLEKGDKITVSVSDDDLRINTGSDKTFFGVFMLGSTKPDHGAPTKR
ncbi:uncharacterized protein LOC121429973 [Lytechinus variegatus]|uniref:uncharacterized protein LOC121429973 n=1 Tax=Lytechinus variegatus TaxID=7654 RepID=UPI001BB259A0|nr:uncharacterized protein LOC121429973 [Lytechinus variegatus]